MDINTLSENQLRAIVDNPGHFEQDQINCARERLAYLSNPKQVIFNNTQWFYTFKRQRIGPVPESVIVQKIETGDISATTMLWTQGIPTWTPAKKTKFWSCFNNDSTQPPPLAGDTVDNTYIWFLAFAPLIGSILGIVFFGGTFLSAGIIAGVLTLLMGFMDDLTLKRAGYEYPSFIWILLFVPVYLFLRARALEHNYSYFIVWMVSFFLIFFFNLMYFGALGIYR